MGEFLVAPMFLRHHCLVKRVSLWVLIDGLQYRSNWKKERGALFDTLHFDGAVFISTMLVRLIRRRTRLGILLYNVQGLRLHMINMDRGNTQGGRGSPADHALLRSTKAADLQTIGEPANAQVQR